MSEPTIQYCSDLHLEFSENGRFLKKNPLIPRGDILLLAGDIVPFSLMDKHAAFFDFVADHFEMVYWLPGNHEYYYYPDAALKAGVLNEKIRSNVFLVNDRSISYRGINFIFSTLWSRISRANQWEVQKGLSDFHVIKFKGRPFTPADFNQLHEAGIAFVKQELSRENQGTTIVVTHHVPTFLHYPEEYKGSVLNEAFAVELRDFIEASQVDYWLYGHHHMNIPDFKIGNTKLMTNQMGYVENNEHLLFNTGKLIEIELNNDL